MSDMLLERIRPADMDQMWEKLYLVDIQRLKEKYPVLIQVDCVACGSSDYRPVIEKSGYIYNRCNQCETLFLSPRLSQEGISDFFAHSNAMNFLGQMHQSVALERKTRIFAPRWQIIKKALYELGYSFPIANCLEVGPSIRLFTSVVLESCDVCNVDVVEPSIESETNLKEIGVSHIYIGTEQDFTGKLTPIYDIVVCNNVLEHPTSPVSFINNVKCFLRPGGALIFCSPTGSGIDSLWLKGDQPNLTPPQAQNFITNQGMAILAKRCELSLVRYQSIGQLDVDIIYQHLRQHHFSQNVLPMGILNLLESEGLRHDLQNTLQKHQLTGFALSIMTVGG